MSLAVAAVGAIVAALLEMTIVPYLQIGGVQPDLVLVLAVAWTLLVGFEGGLAWAFVGGLMLDILGARPMGSTAFVLLLCVGAVAISGRFLEPARLLGPAIATFIAALLYAGLLLVLDSSVRGPVPLADPVGAIVSRAVFDAALGGLIGAVAILVRARRGIERHWLDR